MNEPRFGALSSSVDPTKLADTVTGGIIAVSGVIIFLAAQAGVTLFPEDVHVLAENIGNIVSLGTVAFGAVKAAFGAVRKLVVRLSEYTKK